MTNACLHRLMKDWIVVEVRLAKAAYRGHPVPLIEADVISRTAPAHERSTLHCCARCLKTVDRLHNAAQHASTCASDLMVDLLRRGGACVCVYRHFTFFCTHFVE